VLQGERIRPFPIWPPLAEKQRSLIWQRTRDTLRAAKARGWRSEIRGWKTCAIRVVASTKGEADRFASNVAPIIREIRASGVSSNRGVARALNARGVATARDGQWTAVQVGSILQRVS